MRGGKQALPPSLLVLALPPAAVPRAPCPAPTAACPISNPNRSSWGTRLPPPQNLQGGKDLAPQCQSASPHHATGMPRAAPALPALRFAGREGAKRPGGGGPGPLWGLQLPPPACCRALLCPTAEENSLTLQKYWSQVAPTVTSLSKTQPAARPSTPWAERGGAGPQGQHGALGGGTARPRVPPLPPEKERAGRRGVFGCVVLVIINISFWHQHHLVT